MGGVEDNSGLSTVIVVAVCRMHDNSTVDIISALPIPHVEGFLWPVTIVARIAMFRECFKYLNAP